jgi:tRNA dimethylallyltransferase
MQGLTDLPASTPQVRKQIAQEACEVGWDFMYTKLQQIDPLVASRLPPGDTQRISRALEVFYMTGTPMSQFLSAQPYAQSRDSSSFAHLLIALEPLHRDWLHARIQERFIKMLDHDFIGEVKHLLEDPQINAELPAMRAVGYRQAIAYLNDELSYDAFIEAGLAASRQLGKRQLTWLRAMPSRQVIDPSSPQFMSRAIKTCLEHLQQFKSQ